MKKTSLIMISLLSIIVLAACGGPKPLEGAAADKYIENAEEVVFLLNEGKFDEVYAMFDEVMENELPVSDMEAITPMINQSGKFEGIEQSAVQERDGHYIVFLMVNYSEENRTFSVTYNDQDEIAGLYVQ